jgi:hypothetical protein
MFRAERATQASLTTLGARLACALVAALALGCLLASSASAVFYVHPFVKAFGPDGTSGSKFLANRAISVDQSTHDVFVVDRFARRVYRFDSEGKPHPFSEGEEAGKPWLRIPAPTGYELGAVDVAVAPPGAPGGTAGDIYLSWMAEKNPSAASGVEIYSPDGLHLGTLDGSGNPHHTPDSTTSTGQACWVTHDADGNVYVSYCSVSFAVSDAHVSKYVPSGNPVVESDFDSEIFGSGISGTLLAPASGLYVGTNRYPYSLFPGGGGSADASGKGTPFPLPTRTEFSFSDGARTVALDASRGDFYARYDHNASKFLSSAIFQMDEEGTMRSVLPVPHGLQGPLGVGVDEASGTVYVSAYTGSGADAAGNQVRIYGPAVPLEPPSASIDAPSAVTYESASFTGTVNPGGSGEGYETLYRFECTPACPGLYSAPVLEPLGRNRELPADGADHAVSDSASGLQPETQYEVRLVAANGYNNQTVVDSTSFETPPVPVLTAPVATIDPPSEVTAESAHLSGTVDPMGSGEGQGTTYRFEYSLDGLKWTPLESQGPIEGTGPQTVSDELEGLEPNTSYTVRLRAENGGGSDLSDEPHPSFVTEAVPPQVEISPATNVLPTSAQLNGHVNPRNSETTYYFQWGTGDCAASACSSVPASQDAAAGSGGGFVSVHAQIEGLEPGATYHYRLVAASPAGETVSGGSTFTAAAEPPPCEAKRVGLSAALPDCRAYEMVSPPDKAGGDVGSIGFKTRAAADGEAVTFASQAAFAGAEGYPWAGIEYLSSRGAEGWTTRAVMPRQKTPKVVNTQSASTYVGPMSPDLDTGVFHGKAPNPGTNANVEGVDNLFLVTGLRGGSPQFTLLSDSVNPLGEEVNSLGETPPIALVGASEDFGHVVFEDKHNLTPGASGTDSKLYEWDHGTLRLVGILPDDACEAPPCVAPKAVGGAGVQGHGVFGFGTNTDQTHAVSDDGSRIFFTAGGLKPASGVLGQGGFASPGLAGSIYVREDGAQTTQVDASERSEPDPEGPGRSEFLWATPNGDQVLFISMESLVDEDADGGDQSLYRWTAAAPAGERLTLVPTPTLGPTPAHVVGANPDGSIVYLWNAGTVYVLAGGEIRTVAAVGFRSDEAVGQRGFFVGVNQARMTPDGRSLLFHSRSKLTAYDPSNPDCEEDRCLELYLYSYDADELVCVSCEPSGEPPTEDEPVFDAPVLDIARYPGTSTYLSNPISSDGRHVFLTSPDPLVPQDSNGRLDAYVYDVARREHRLLSSGQCNCDSVFMTATPSGHDAFFTTRQQLVRADGDGLADLYDVRVNGGIPAQNALPPAECQGDACQPPPSPPNDPTPASSSYSGPGNRVAQPPRKKRLKHKNRHKRRAHKHARHAKHPGSNSKRKVGQ